MSEWLGDQNSELGMTGQLQFWKRKMDTTIVVICIVSPSQLITIEKVMSLSLSYDISDQMANQQCNAQLLM